MQEDPEIRRLRWRATHRGTREADMMIGGFFEAHHQQWNAQERAWFDALLREQDVDIMAWAIGAQAPPPQFSGSLMEAMQRLDYLKVAR